MDLQQMILFHLHSSIITKADTKMKELACQIKVAICY
uniref:Uncharacterized protein n=1 Tax=Arundo donax TaxID=35708 RepID=A0A0A8ZI67_ARUDO